ncbi:MAG: hypothetical protein IJF76_04135 [Clostridia bacterium]|nr:hypothetical protein [Clostridia bacterium]
MIKLIYGAKGTGKTKRIIDTCNEDALNSTGNVVFLTDTNRYMYELKRTVRFVNVDEFEIQTELGLLGFIRGMLAGNSDITTVYIDGAHRMANRDIADMTWFYNKLEDLAKKNDTSFVLTVSCPESDLPEYMKKYI